MLVWSLVHNHAGVVVEPSYVFRKDEDQLSCCSMEGANRYPPTQVCYFVTQLERVCLQVIPVIGARPFILIGVALAPPAVNAAPGTPAAAAVVASRDRSLGRYSSRVLLQPWHGQQQQQQQSGSNSSSPPLPNEVVTGLKSAVKELLIDFYRQNGGRKPEALLCYRNTSNEGQEQVLREHEYQALRT